MEHGFALINNEFRIAAGQRIIKGPDYCTRVEADELVGVARQTADRILAEADRRYQATIEKCHQVKADMDKNYQDTMEQGYQAGFAKAQRDFAAQINDVLIDRAEIIDRLEYGMVDMLVDSMKTIVGDLGADRILQGIAVKALRKAGRAQFARLRVHPDRVESVQNVVLSVKKEFEGLEWIEVVADTNLQPEDCLLQTQAGILDFSIDTQLRVLRECLYARVHDAGAP